MKPLSTALKRLQHKGRYSKHTPYPTHRLMLQSTQLTHRSMTQTHTSWRYTQKHDADTNPPIIKIHTEAQCRHMRTLHEGYASYTQKHDADTCAWDVRAVGPIHDCQHQFLSLWILWAILALLKTVNTNFCLCGYCELYWHYSRLSTPISVSVDIVRDIGPTHDCQHRFLSLWILWSIVTSSQQRMTKINSTSSHAATSQSENKISSHRALQVLTVLQRPTGLEIRSNQSILSVNRIFSGSSFSLHLASINERNSSHTDMPQYWAHHLYCISHAIQTWQSHTHTQNGANSTQWLH